MNIKRLMTATALLALAAGAMKAQTIVPPQSKGKGATFAIFTDTRTWQECRDELEAYRDVLAEEQLPTYIIYDDWQRPEEVKEIIRRLHRRKGLEGAVFVGDIPVAMVRRAQHLTSAFKMDETTDRRESSVPSDRFYDDLHLEFTPLGTDSTGFHYYDLAVRSPQSIRCDIYTGRIKPVADGTDRHEQIRRYLRKAVAEHRSANRLDQFFSYTGHGSYSNSLAAWTGEAFTLREQMPGVFDGPGRARFMRFTMFAYPKDEVANQLRREDLDLAIFHEHGTPDRQYLSATPPTHDLDGHIDAMKANRRDYARTWVKDEAGLHAAYRKTAEKDGLDSTWYAGHDDPAQLRRDSLDDARTGMLLEDISRVRPNARMVIFDACYNGDFREADYVAGRYIFAGGRTVVAFANSVNVLQDKQANDLLGLLGMGARVGQWAMLTNILESHVIGDPTLRFRSFTDEVDGTELCGGAYDEGRMLRLLSSPYVDVQSLALHRLHREGYRALSDTLRRKFETSPWSTVRYTCLALLEQLNDDNFRAVLVPALTDPNEFIRRTAVRKMAAVGDNAYVPHLVRAYVEDNQSTRVAFNISLSLYVFDRDAVAAALDSVLQASYAAPREKELFRKQLEEAYSKRESSDEAIVQKKEKERWRILYIQSLRNYPVHGSVGDYLRILRSPDEPEQVKVALLDALAWYRLAVERGAIAEECRKVWRDKKQPAAVRKQAERTYYRLTNK